MEGGRMLLCFERDRLEDFSKAAQFERNVDDGYQHHQPDTEIFHDGNQGRSTQTAALGIRRQDGKGDD